MHTPESNLYDSKISNVNIDLTIFTWEWGHEKSGEEDGSWARERLGTL
jgi:hypothetical protein